MAIKTDRDYQHAVILMLLATEQLTMSNAADATAMRNDLETLLNRYAPAEYKRADFTAIQEGLIAALA
ncbi:hypothetical protein EOA37_21185 [Mesorhizobium sp. M2A.F.Ca.ET.015.02.1.1]|uniref:hypothetical protein n=1 Tax=Mesorhizobium sp. M2A.F.Ca.ET.015.02.1.1 TaxID=2496758 RepID=UPI000FCBE721|nr:hypothetical protein [Mesorhizobium sp. M2A.F.Ca.ET.015.02.1.1]RUW39167.1 hypothetical protein EOA37_21185 [Mesorhizobium sp. M2A.F.Ca.ET.015.02.1.1]